MKLLFIVILVIIFYHVVFKSRNHNKTNASPAQPEFSEAEKTDFSQMYQQKYLFSLYEKNEFRKLLAWSDQNNLYVFPKVRLLDIIEPRRNANNYKSLLWKIQAKHVDFVVCDREFKIQFIIELDDNSHKRKDRVDRDEFIAQALKGAGYVINRTNGISDEFLDNLKH